MQLVYTNEKCVGCNKCIRSCSSVGACIAVSDKDGRAKIEVDPVKCVGCGACSMARGNLMTIRNVFFLILQKESGYHCYWPLHLRLIILPSMKVFWEA